MIVEVLKISGSLQTAAGPREQDVPMEAAETPELTSDSTSMKTLVDTSSPSEWHFAKDTSRAYAGEVVGNAPEDVVMGTTPSAAGEDSAPWSRASSPLTELSSSDEFSEPETGESSKTPYPGTGDWWGLPVEERLKITRKNIDFDYECYAELLPETWSGLERVLYMWAKLVGETNIPRCHGGCAEEGGYEANCAWAYLECRKCEQVFCADYFSRW